MLRYTQRNAHGDGELELDGHFEGITYSGKGEGRNNPEMEAIRGVGPIPRGLYAVSLCEQKEHPHLAMPVFRLLPVGHDAHGRDGFLLHGDNVDHDASEGCIIAGKTFRLKLEADHETELRVV